LTVTFWEPDAPTLAPAAPAFDVDVVVLVTAARTSIIKAMQRDNKKGEKKKFDRRFIFFLDNSFNSSGSVGSNKNQYAKFRAYRIMNRE